MTRALKATDRRYARILERLGYARSDMQAAPVVAHPVDPDVNEDERDAPMPSTSEEIAALRAEYKRVVGTRPFHGWDAATLRERIANAQAPTP